jgi:hypothetical protein
VTARQRHWWVFKDKRFTASLLRLNSMLLTGALESCCWVLPTTQSTTQRSRTWWAC